MKCNLYSCSQNGNLDKNEDYIFAEVICEKYLLCIVADGMGELDYASDASKLVINTITEFISSEILRKEITIENLLPKAIIKANEHILEERKRLFCKMGAAVAIVLYHNSKSYISWLGDVRVYFQKDNLLHLLTIDHTIENLKNITVLNPKKYTHILIRSINGSDLELEEIPCLIRNVKSGDRIIICSDGFYNIIHEKKMQKLPLKNIISDIGNAEDDYSVIEMAFYG